VRPKATIDRPDPPGLDQAYKRIGQFPHCDAQVLHAPGECGYCDDRADWQALRLVWGVAFTGHEPLAGQTSCPSDARRGVAGAHVWPGNQPQVKLQ
jgi:hypothetical protein